jgi:5-methylcytosine-specific restriction endonuclease McrA
MAPERIVSWQRAVVWALTGKVDVIEEYDEIVASPSVSLRTPAVVRLRRNLAPKRRVHRFSRMGVFVRDGFRCQYCAESRPHGGLNLDHVVPRARGGVTSWENVVAACYACNTKKGGRTPEEAGMRLLRAPVQPSGFRATASLWIARSIDSVPRHWRDYVAA